MPTGPTHSLDGPTIRRLRDERRWTQDDLVQAIRRAAIELGFNIPGVNVQMVSRWENGKVGISNEYVALLEHAFSRSLVVDDHNFEDAMRRRAFLLGSTAAVGLTVVNALGNEPWQRLAASLRGRTAIDQATVDNLALLNLRFAEMFQPVDPRNLTGPVRAHFDTITDLLRTNAMADPIRRRLTSLAAEMSILIGWLHKEQGDHLTAQQCFTAGLTAAVEAGDNNLGAYAVASASTLDAFRSSPEQSIDLLTSADVRGARLDRADISTQVWIDVLQAEVHTRTSNTAAAFEALDRAGHNVELIDPEDSRRPMLGYFDRSSVIGERGITAVRLDVDAETEASLREALATASDFPKTQSRLLINVARAHAAHGRHEEACQAAISALDIAEQTGSEVGIDDVRAFRRDQAGSIPAELLGELDDRLAVQL